MTQVRYGSPEQNIWRKRFATNMRAVVAIFAVGLCCCIGCKTTEPGFVRINTFEICRPVQEVYAPWPDPEKPAIGFEVELITITNGSFVWSYLTDACSPVTNSGPLLVFKDHIYLNNPGVWEPFRIAGRADGTPVLLKRADYEAWKKTKRIHPWALLYLQKRGWRRASHPVERMAAGAAAVPSRERWAATIAHRDPAGH